MPPAVDAVPVEADDESAAFDAEVAVDAEVEADPAAPPEADSAALPETAAEADPAAPLEADVPADPALPEPDAQPASELPSAMVPTATAPTCTNVLLSMGAMMRPFPRRPLYAVSEDDDGT